MNFILLFIVLCSIAAGFFLARYPSRAIQIQIKFYRHINWRIEPVDMGRELFNTMVMGIFLIVFAAGTVCYEIIRGVLR